MAKRSYLGVPDRPPREIRAGDHPKQCTKACTLYGRPECLKATCLCRPEKKTLGEAVEK